MKINKLIVMGTLLALALLAAVIPAVSFLFIVGGDRPELQKQEKME